MSVQVFIFRYAKWLLLTRTRDLDVGAAGAAEGLGGKDLVVVVAGLEAVLGPGAEVVLHVDGTRGALVLADREELGEGLGARDGGLVDLGVGADLVGRAVAGQGADLGAGGAGVVAVVLDNVVLWWVCQWLLIIKSSRSVALPVKGLFNQP